MNPEKPPVPNPSPETEPDLERRETLKRLGRYAAYTPPVVLTLLASKKALAGSPVGPGDEP